MFCSGGGKIFLVANLDALSEVLKFATLKGALFYNAEFSAPWGIRSPASAAIATHLTAGAAHVIIYHLVTEGRAWVQLETGPRVNLRAGDIVMFPHGHPHLMGSGAPAVSIDHEKELQRILSQGLEAARMGGGGEITKLVCGYMICEPRINDLLLSGLPSLLTIHIRNDPPGVWLEDSIRLFMVHAASSASGRKPCLLNFPKSYLSKHCAAISPCYQQPRQAGWQVRGIRMWEKRSPCCTANLLVPGQSRTWRLRPECLALYWQNVFVITWVSRR